MQSIFISLLSLITSSFFVQFSNAAITTLVAVTVAQNGGAQSDVALIASAYSIGFIVGCFLAPPQIFRIGLVRGYAAAAGIMAITIVVLEMLDSIVAWTLLRFTMGLSFAAVMAIADSWLNQKAPSDMRGRIIAAYSIVLGLASVLSQVFFLSMDATEDGFVLTFAVSMNLAVVLVALGTTNQPSLDGPAPAYLRKLSIVSVPATMAAFAAGFCTASLIAIFPFYLSEHGVDENQVALSVAVIYLGRLAGQWPVGNYSDRIDRRTLIVALCLLIIPVCLLSIVFGGGQGVNISGERGPIAQLTAYGSCFLLGCTLFPLYSVGTALAFDRADGRPMIDISTTMLVANSIGGMLGPMSVMALSALAGDYALHVSIIIICALLAFVSAYGRFTRATADSQTRSIKGVAIHSVGMAEAVAEVVEDRLEESEDTEQ